MIMTAASLEDKTSALAPVPPLPRCLGAHYSIAGGYENALFAAARYGCRAVQIFTKNASAWAERTVTNEDRAALDRARQETGITRILSHTAYLINLASPDDALHRRSVDALAAELARCAALGIGEVVMHPGAHTGSGADAGLRRVISGIDAALDRQPDAAVRLLVETTAGQGTGIGHTFEQLAAIIDGVSQKQRLGVCLDTCHVFAAGYDIRDAEAVAIVLDIFDALIGLERLHALHINDAKREAGSRVDRHAHIGEGCIGLAGFKALMNDSRLAGIPKVLETPKEGGGRDWDRINFDRLRRLVRD
ncbi:MAG: deoxyribonuclease IV [Pseudomonadota bacterium]